MLLVFPKQLLPQDITRIYTKGQGEMVLNQNGVNLGCKGEFFCSEGGGTLAQVAQGEVADAPSLGMFKVRLDRAPGSLA